jgi:hypothetical protein
MCIAAPGAFNDTRFDMHTRLCTSVLAIIAATALTACNRTDSGTTPGAGGTTGTGTSSSSGTGATAGAGTGGTSSSSTATGPGASASAASSAR